MHFLNENVGISIKISLKFVHKGPINNVQALVQILAWRRPGDKPLSEPMMIILLTHICVTRPEWVNVCCWHWKRHETSWGLVANETTTKSRGALSVSNKYPHKSFTMNNGWSLWMTWCGYQIVIQNCYSRGLWEGYLFGFLVSPVSSDGPELLGVRESDR